MKDASPFCPIFAMKFDSLILKQCVESLKLIFHTLYVAAIPLSDHFLTEQQQAEGIFLLLPLSLWPITDFQWWLSSCTIVYAWSLVIQ